MRVQVLIIGFVLALAGLAAWGQEGSRSRADYARPVAAASNDFGFRLFAQLYDGTGNVVLSPTSLSAALAMTYNGAAGATKEGMAKALGVPGMPLAELNARQRTLLDLVRSSDPKATVTIANALWVNRGVTLKSAFQQAAVKHYQAKVTRTNVTGDGGVKEINAWVAEATKRKITTLLKPGDLDPLTRLVLTNAVYFKGAWHTSFDTAQTRQAPFTLAGGKTKTVPMMTQRGQYAYFRNDDVQMLRLPYGSGNMAMYLLLPAPGKELNDLRPKLTATQWEWWVKGLKDVKCRVFLPRFSATGDKRLNAQLAALGMPEAFNEHTADFRGITGKKDLYIKLVQHKAVLEVNEKGTVAAAASAVVMNTKSAPLEEVFRADRPFLCAIRHEGTGALLFLGAIVNPE